MVSHCLLGLTCQQILALFSCVELSCLHSRSLLVLGVAPSANFKQKISVFRAIQQQQQYNANEQELFVVA